MNRIICCRCAAWSTRTSAAGRMVLMNLANYNQFEREMIRSGRAMRFST